VQTCPWLAASLQTSNRLLHHPKSLVSQRPKALRRHLIHIRSPKVSQTISCAIASCTCWSLREGFLGITYLITYYQEFEQGAAKPPPPRPTSERIQHPTRASTSPGSLSPVVLMSKVIRSVKNVTKGYSSTQIKVRNGTWDPCSDGKRALVTNTGWYSYQQ